MRTAVLLTFCLFSAGSFAQEWNALNPHELVIVRSTKDYAAALETARDAARRLGYPLNVADYKPHETLGLSMSPADCEAAAWEYPCYAPRGYGGPGGERRYVSIEWSTGYEGFKPGYYIVVVGDGAPGSESSRSALALAKKHYKDAYAKTTRVWFGCMH